MDKVMEQIKIPVHFDSPAVAYAAADVVRLSREWTVAEALESIRRSAVAERIVYFYVTDADARLEGVVPTRRLLTAALDDRVADIMARDVVALPSSATLLEACEFFVLHKLLAVPVVDEDGTLRGVIDITVFTEEMFDFFGRERADDVFESLGLRIARLQRASPFRAFRFRFPWLTATIISGTACALLVSAFEMTLSGSLVLAFFLTLVLGLGDSVAMQSMTVTIQALHASRPTFRWYLRTMRRELATAVMLGSLCGACVGLVVWIWRMDGFAAVAIGSSIVLIVLAACMFGVTTPALLHAMRLDPKISAGPLTLAFTDVMTLLCYFSIASLLL